ncbi:peptidase family T4 protein [Microdochium trichocladiopsis]|uniref:Peptidase family T4 protein n=1 Tax=Microdochium trichocladiopsis TaxID=1682393 RepID=A0A9P8YKV2_9PEZI|nr:peptidase family T4 protein [Microdochium trichocladiopsis]KAH7040855.1 peptidase family T4 protein [Microdochium trichocladiopsis]
MSTAPSTTTSGGAPPTAAQPRMRLRELVPDLRLGDWAPGPLNSITDVPGVKVHVQSIHSDDPSTDTGTGRAVHTGVTCILPRDNWFHSACHAGIFRFNGSGEFTGSHWIEETGLLHSPIVLTNSFSVGAAYQGIYEYTIKTLNAAAAAAKDGGAAQQEPADVDWFLLPVVGETFDGYLNDLSTFAVQPHHIVHGLENVSAAAVPEGATGGGTGMICHMFKGGTGSASRLNDKENDGETTYTVAALVQANYGRPRNLRIAGYPVGRILAAEMAAKAAADADEAARQAALESEKDRKDGSIIVVLATDAPLSPIQLQRLAKRATVGLARVGGQGHNPSGDIFLAFSTGNEIPVQSYSMTRRALDPFRATVLEGEDGKGVKMVDDTTINGLFEAAAEATEEAIYNVLCMGETMIGHKGRKIDGLPLDRVKDILEKYMAVDERAQMTV